MSFQPKTEPGSPVFSSTSDKSLATKSIHELIQVLRVTWQTEEYDKVEEVLEAREKNFKEKIDKLEEKFQFENLARINAEDQLKKKEEQCEKGKKAQERYELLLKEVKQSGLDKKTIENLRNKNKELQCENLKLLESKKKCEVEGNAVDGLRKKVAELEAEKKKNLETINELNVENGRFVELLDRVEKLEENEKLIISNSEKHDINEANPGFPSKVKEVKEFNDEMNADDPLPLQRSKHFHQSHGASERMVRKKLASGKDNKKDTDTKKYDKSNKLRCTPHNVVEMFQDLTEDKMAIVDEMGFGALRNLPSFNLSIKVMMELVQCYNLHENKIYTTLGEVKITAQKIGYALGLNATGHTFEEKINEKKLTEEENEAVKMFKGSTLLSLKNMVKNTPIDTKENMKKFKRAFLLYIQKSFLCPTSSPNVCPRQCRQY
ncbi:hypothetical protein PIB30_083889 [Stylosanthes scabra]|uniref:FRIGIDA-like protein n=1 Tax=Stylosanthes scabra TaxID=79078 RepID=A0ABU6QSY4_9FABA|nr:hypothetical protein [Stylosanthes scabra]